MSEPLDRPDTLVVGLLGGIGSGKSEVARLLAHPDGRIISGDLLGHEALKQPAIRQAVVGMWGQGVLGEDSEIARGKLAAVVFGDPEARRNLEQLVHPWIKEAITREVARARSEGLPLVVLDAAVMLEAQWDGPVDRLVFVDTPRAVRLQRIAETRGWTEEEVTRREQAQLPLEKKARRAHATIHNGGGLAQLASEVLALKQRWALSPAKNVSESYSGA